MSMVNNTELAVGGGKPSTDSTREAGVSIQQALAENANETAMTRDQLREILRWWLSPLDQSSNHNAAAGKARRSGAAEWLMIQRGVYEEWKTAVLQGKQ